MYRQDLVSILKSLINVGKGDRENSQDDYEKSINITTDKRCHGHKCTK